jgi:hypothetical protein
VLIKRPEWTELREAVEVELSSRADLVEGVQRRDERVAFVERVMHLCAAGHLHVAHSLVEKVFGDELVETDAIRRDIISLKCDVVDYFLRSVVYYEQRDGVIIIIFISLFLFFF